MKNYHIITELGNMTHFDCADTRAEADDIMRDYMTQDARQVRIYERDGRGDGYALVKRVTRDEPIARPIGFGRW